VHGMPLPMVHVSIAVKLWENEGVSEIPPSFLLGSIAPDAIHMRKNTNREDKKYTHFNIESGNNLDPIKEKYRNYIAQNPDSDWHWFVRGYFAHVLTDYYWFHRVFRTNMK
jgi:hypothetical protein